MPELHCGDNLQLMRAMPTASVDLVFGSPPYEAARTYGIDFKLRGQAWVDWMVARWLEMQRVSRGIVAMVVEGQTRQFAWSAAPALLMADLHRAGLKLRKPPAFHRVGIPGSGGPDWLRNDYEFVVVTSTGKLPWSDNTAMGHPPKYAPGGACSNRKTNGARTDTAKKWGEGGLLPETKNGDAVRRRRPSHILINGRDQWGGTPHASSGEGRNTNGKHKAKTYLGRGTAHDGATGTTKGSCAADPVLANPGNVIHCIVGGGVMGSKLAHENEAPFPESLAEFFVRSFCPAGGTVLDPFTGSGTTAAVAIRTGRNFIGIDIRESQIDLTRRRIAEVQKELFQ